MKKNIRYVAVYLSSGRFIPNEASAVLKNKFGDCKDKTTLMSALLAAKGIAAEPVLINLGNAYTLAEPPTLAALNHAILYLPEFDLYDDPTASRAAFGVLALESYDKPVVRVSAGGAKLARTPAMKTDDHTAYAKTTINVAADGTVAGQTEESNTGVLATALRTGGATVQTLGGAVAARRVLQNAFTPGTGHFDLGNFAETTDPVAVKGSFAMDDRFKPPAASARAVVPRGMALTAWPGSFLLGSRLNGRRSPFVCYAGRQTEDIEARFDPGLPLPVPLAPVAIDNPTFSFRSAVKVEERTLKIHREFVSRVEQQVCPPDLEAKIAADLNTVRVNVFSSFGFGASQPTAASKPAEVAVGQANSRREVDDKGYVKNLALELGTKPPATPNPTVAQNPPAAQSPRPAPSSPNAPAAPQTVEITRVAAIGQKLRVEFLYSIQPDCSSSGETNVRIVEAPQHGTLMVENGQGFTNFPKDNQRYDCNTRKSDGTLVFYEPESGFSGKDSITVDVIFPFGQSSKRHYSIEVK
jgi:hypothetical protein